MKTLNLIYLENGRVYNENKIYSYDNENLGTTLTIEVPEYYENFTFVMDCQNGTVTKQIELGTGSTTYSLLIDDSLTLTGTLELQLWATILSGTETVKVQWEKYNLTVNDALNISEITAESNPDIIATHTAQITELVTKTDILDNTGDGTKYLADDGTYKYGIRGTYDYLELNNKPQINNVVLSGNKTSADLGLQVLRNVEIGEQLIGGNQLVRLSNNKLYSLFELVGTDTTINSAAMYYSDMTEIGVDKFLVVYSDAGNSNRLTAIVLTVSGDTISYGTKLQILPTSCSYFAVAKADADKVVIAYRDNADSYIKCRVLTISGTTISASGGIQTLCTDTTGNGYVELCQMDVNKLVVAYQRGLNYGSANALTVSDTEIAVGNMADYRVNRTFQVTVSKVDSNKCLIIGCEYLSGGWRAIVGTVNADNTLTFGSGNTFTFTSGIYTYCRSLQLDTNKVIFIMDDGLYDVFVWLLTVSGTTVTAKDPLFLGRSLNTQFGLAKIDTNSIVVFYSGSVYPMSILQKVEVSGNILTTSAMGKAPANAQNMDLSVTIDGRFLGVYSNQNITVGRAFLVRVNQANGYVLGNPIYTSNVGSAPYVSLV